MIWPAESKEADRGNYPISEELVRVQAGGLARQCEGAHAGWVKWFRVMMSVSRMFVRAVLAVIVLAVVCPALAVFCLAAKVSDWRLSSC